jgi:hypothetical protein
VDDEGDAHAGGTDLSGELDGGLQFGPLGGAGGDLLREDAGDPGFGEGVQLGIRSKPRR